MAIETGGEAVLESNTGYVVCNIRLVVTRQQIAFESVKLMPTTYVPYVSCIYTYTNLPRKSQNSFSSIEDIEALSARSATFAKALKRHRIRNTFHGNTFATNEHRECGIH
ncbi:hypothetical protein ALC60_08181 [Trachymyrmex zeteki]|uniref:Uncharacterized protein n=1 Tax=Mycetomoellerius zeteki TaxID=64791 RepID=A0A151WY46_9HYME|nr:hypothetical protein ALC60_08181 [Trachymyrmex zeteki]